MSHEQPPAAGQHLAEGYYEEYWRSEGYRPRGEAASKAVELLSAEIGATDAVLDYGCGDGHRLGLLIAGLCGSYAGVDVSASAIEEARTLGLDARLIAEDGVLPFEGCMFDVVIAHEVLEHVFLPHQAAREVLRVLRPGGRFLVTVPNGVYWRRRLDLMVGRWNPMGDDLSVEQPWRDPHIRFFTLRTLRSMLEQERFQVLTAGGHEGGVFVDLPVLRRLGKAGSGRGRTYAWLRDRFPSLLGRRLHVVARKPPT